MKHICARILALALSLMAAHALAADEIKFQKVNSIVSTRYGQSSQTIRFEAVVANLAYNKAVYAHLAQPGGSWIDVPLTYNRSISGNREVWTAVYQPAINTTYDPVFALKYVVNGQTYWDNNAGQNYTIARDSGAKLTTGLNVYSSNYAPTVNIGLNSTAFYGGVTVRNLSPTKTVRIHYSTNNWASTQVATAAYSSSYWYGAYSTASNPNPYGFEEWSFNLNVGSANQVDYAIEYVVNGQTYWDNNYGLNYHVNLVRQ